jgi:hypothetical protein
MGLICMHMYFYKEIGSLILRTTSWNRLGKEPKLQESVLGFEKTFYSLPETHLHWGHGH